MKILAAPKAPPVIVSERRKKILSRITRRGTAEFREVGRAPLILEIEKGGSNSGTARAMGCSTPKVARRRERWIENQDALRQTEENPAEKEQPERMIRDVLKDRSRPGAPAIHRKNTVGFRRWPLNRRRTAGGRFRIGPPANRLMNARHGESPREFHPGRSPVF